MTVAHRSLLMACAVLWAGLHSPFATAHASNGTVIADAELATVQGGKRHLLGKEAAQILFFFRPDQDHSRDVMKQMALCEREHRVDDHALRREHCAQRFRTCQETVVFARVHASIPPMTRRRAMASASMWYVPSAICACRAATLSLRTSG